MVATHMPQRSLQHTCHSDRCNTHATWLQHTCHSARHRSIVASTTAVQILKCACIHMYIEVCVCVCVCVRGRVCA